ncbi:hypothetical protein D9619_006966 [Psilocybe cf. subviscida]|uniref:ABM domain-containing protein n=1 Tax=Psilocybe cf. subviscida TaxID=2480587 RepID=A0A8H5EWG3_9AGAR|nr:hypothetical protein D9619_006966 [Psilocybe cf. subviscida]
MPIHELIYFKPTEAVLADPTAALAPAIKFLSTVNGCSGLYFGPSEEDKDVAFIVIGMSELPTHHSLSHHNTNTPTTVWDTYDHHKAVIDTQGYPGIVGLADTIAGNSTMLHVPFRDAPEPALGAPTTEVAVFTLKPGKTIADVDAILASMMQEVGLEAKDDCVVGTWGQTREDAEKVVLFFGWASTKRHYEIVGQDKYKPLVGDLIGTVDIKYWHAPFKKFA